MPRMLPTVIALLATVTLAASAPAQAAPKQIEDPAGDHPVPFMDLTGVGLALTKSKGANALEVTFHLAGPVTAQNRAAMTGYSFTATAGSCALLVRYIPYPEGAFAADGFVTTRCGAGRDAGGTSKLVGSTIVVTATIRDLRGVAPGQTLTKLRAYTSPAEGMYHDDTTAPSALGDSATSDKAWTIR